MIFIRQKTGFGPDIKLWLLGIFWRGWELSPLFDIGKKCCIFFTNGISFGYWRSSWDITYYVGNAIIKFTTKHNEKSKRSIWVLKYKT